MMSSTITNNVTKKKRNKRIQLSEREELIKKQVLKEIGNHIIAHKQNIKKWLPRNYITNIIKQYKFRWLNTNLIKATVAREEKKDSHKLPKILQVLLVLVLKVVLIVSHHRPLLIESQEDDWRVVLIVLIIPCK